MLAHGQVRAFPIFLLVQMIFQHPAFGDDIADKKVNCYIETRRSCSDSCDRHFRGCLNISLKNGSLSSLSKTRALPSIWTKYYHDFYDGAELTQDRDWCKLANKETGKPWKYCSEMVRLMEATENCLLVRMCIMRAF